MIIQISSGQGPAECELAVSLLVKSLQKEFPDLKMIHAVHGKKNTGYSSCRLKSHETLPLLEGSILWICQSPYRPNHKRKNWYVDLSILKETPQLEDDGKLRIDTFHSGGNGGQNVNKVETGVRITHTATGLSAASTTARSQHMNRKLAMNRLCEMLSEVESNNKKAEKTLAWLEHSRLERGNPIRIYQGIEFKRKYM